jgi:hypothetical protein
VVKTTSTICGVTSKARMTVPVGSQETGDLTLADNRASTALAEFQIKGKFTFSKADTLTLSGSVELPAGLALNKEQSVSVGIGNVSADGTSSLKGKVGDTARFSVTMSSASLITDGLDTEGTTRGSTKVKETPPRKLQVALILGGVAYCNIVNGDYTVTDKAGQINSRR